MLRGGGGGNRGGLIFIFHLMGEGLLEEGGLLEGGGLIEEMR